MKEFNPQPKPTPKAKQMKLFKHVGKHTKEYEKWKKNVAIPYLDSQGPRVCAKGCGKGWPLDVGHIQSRGAHPELKMMVNNVEWQCPAYNRFGSCDAFKSI